jgi:hypothetical protein
MNIYEKGDNRTLAGESITYILVGMIDYMLDTTHKCGGRITEVESH